MLHKNLQRVYISSELTEDKQIILSSEHKLYLNTVLRLSKRDKIRVFNALDGEFLAEIFSKDALVVIKKIRDPLPKIIQKIDLGLCLIKNLALSLNLGVQLGMTGFIPILSQNCQIRVFNRKRYEKCLIEATEQSDRLDVPLILSEAQTITKFMTQESISRQGYDLIIFCNERLRNGAKIQNLADIQNKISIANKIFILIGPEGGFSVAEQDLIEGIVLSGSETCSVSLSDSILRSETAVACALSQMILLRGK